MGLLLSGPERANLRREVLGVIRTSGDLRLACGDADLPTRKFLKDEALELQVGAALEYADSQGIAALARFLRVIRGHAPDADMPVVEGVLARVSEELGMVGRNLKGPEPQPARVPDGPRAPHPDELFNPNNKEGAPPPPGPAVPTLTGHKDHGQGHYTSPLTDPPAWTYDIFIAHDKRDRQLGLDLWQQLRATQWRVFIDDILLPGDDWQTEIPKAQSTSWITLVLVSPHLDKAYYAQEEVATAIAMAQDPQKKHRVIPVRVGQLPGGDHDIPYGLRTRMALTLTAGAEGVARFVTELNAVLLELVRRARGEDPHPTWGNELQRGLVLELDRLRAEEEALLVAGGGIDGLSTLRARMGGIRNELRMGGLQPGDMLSSRFRLLERVGKGGIATVWRAWEPERRRCVAVKVLHPQHAGDESTRQRFFRGAREMAEMAHQHIITVFEKELHDPPFHYFVMEHAPGADLYKAICTGHLSRPELLRVLRQTASALDFAHARGRVHRDVKPHNILLMADGGARLADFDLVLVTDSSHGTRTGAMLGTFAYASPEAQRDASKVDARADVFSLTMTTIHSLTGKELDYFSLIKTPEKTLERMGFPAAAIPLLASGIDLDKDQRPSSAGALMEALELALRDAPGQQAQAAEDVGREDESGGSPAPEAGNPWPYTPGLVGNTSPSAGGDTSQANQPSRLDHSGQVTAKPEEKAGAGSRSPGPVTRAGLVVAAPSSKTATRPATKAAMVTAGVAAALFVWSRFGATHEVRRNTLGMDFITIPQGTFTMGSNDGASDEKPPHPVTVSAFRMGKTEVTKAQYQACVDAGACTAPDTDTGCNYNVEGRDKHPVNCVDHAQATAFANWVGGSLPTEAQWEFAARGHEGRKYPWGNTPEPSCVLAVFNDSGQYSELAKMGCRTGAAAPVCSKTKGNTPEGLCDMAGNVWEWTADWYGSYSTGPQLDPTGATSGTIRVLRGGSWVDDAGGLLGAYRDGLWPGGRNDHRGFRVVLPPAPPVTE